MLISPAEVGRVKVHNDLEGYDFTDEELQKPSRDEIEACKTRTLAALESALGAFAARNSVGAIKGPSSTEPTFVRYTAAATAPGASAASSERLVRIHETKQDPLAPPMFKLKKQYGSGRPPSPPTTILRAPTRKVTAEDQANWKIPPAISNWVNPRGLIIPLATRVALDGRGLEDFSVSDKFGKFAEAMYQAEQAATDEVLARERILRRLEAKKREEEELRLQQLAAAARAGAGMAPLPTESSSDAYGGVDVSAYVSTKIEDTDDAERQRQREERRRELERQLRSSSGAVGAPKSSMDAARDRDVSEQIALGAAPRPSGGVRFDERLFTRGAGEATAAGMGGDGAYDLYDTALFADRSTVGLHRPAKGLGFADGGGAGDGASAGRQGPVQFERAAEREGVTATVGGKRAAEAEDGGAGKKARRAGRDDDDEEEEEE